MTRIVWNDQVHGQFCRNWYTAIRVKHPKSECLATIAILFLGKIVSILNSCSILKLA